MLLMLCVACSSDSGGGPNDPPDDPDPTGGSIIWVDSAEAAPGTQVQVNVLARIGTAVQGVTLPLLLNGADFVIDSVSYIGTMLEADPVIELDTISADTVRVIRAYRKEFFVEPDSGLFLKVFVSIDESSSNQVISIDTISIVMQNGAVASLTLADTTTNPYPNEYIPEFYPSVIRVTDQPTKSY